VYTDVTADGTCIYHSAFKRLIIWYKCPLSFTFSWIPFFSTEYGKLKNHRCSVSCDVV
jgi:hypothetical protein